MVVVWEKKAKAQRLPQKTQAKLIQLISAVNNEVRHQICSPFHIFINTHSWTQQVLFSPEPSRITTTSDFIMSIFDLENIDDTNSWRAKGLHAERYNGFQITHD